MTHEHDLDAALARLARAEADAAPAPRPELIARILADAADVSAAAHAARPAAQPGPVIRPVRSRTRWGWFGGALAAMALSLSAGVGAGYAGVEPTILPLVDEAPARGPRDTFGGQPF